MKTTSSAFLTCLLCLLPASFVLAQEDDGEMLVTNKMCYACHQMEAASLGPPHGVTS